MSSGLPPILAAAHGQPTVNAFNFNGFPSPFNYLFPPQISGVVPNGPSQGSGSRGFKVKRHRQRVDAGEPRNTYQGTSTSSTQSVQSSYGMKVSSTIQKTRPEEIERAERGEQENHHQPHHQQQPEDVTGDSSTSSETVVKDEEEPTEENGTEQQMEETEEDEELRDEEDKEREESPESNGSSSSSKRKSFLPQKIGEELGIEFGDEPEQINVTVGNGNLSASEDVGDDLDDVEVKEFSALQHQLRHGSNDMQKHVYSSFIEQQRRQLAAVQAVQASKINCEQLISMLKNEVLTGLMKNMEKVVKDWITEEVSKQEAAQVAPPPVPFHPIFPANPLFHLPTPHPAGGIFPANFNAFNAFSALRRNFQDNSDEPKKKRVKLEVKKEENNRKSPSSSSASPPLERYFPAPTMVPYGSMNFGGSGGDREDSPTNSDELSDGGYDGNGGSSMLTPMHLRKAKLMFFYTRYPNSNLLKSYFPDIRFNKNNTAQLVKWFSNFREFYYNQMEKFGRQLLAEGVRDRSEIFVTKDSELFKALNSHYNRNNHIKPPDRLVLVVQETLREFYDAIKLGKDMEPSWKKTIYKVINRLDDQIPDYFKEPNFLELLE